jgi:hypothetical protein
MGPKILLSPYKSNEVGTTLKHPETINGNVKNLNKGECLKMKDKGECHF